jgi:hypothetical protein
MLQKGSGILEKLNYFNIKYVNMEFTNAREVRVTAVARQFDIVAAKIDQAAHDGKKRISEKSLFPEVVAELKAAEYAVNISFGEWEIGWGEELTEPKTPEEEEEEQKPEPIVNPDI